MKTINRTTYKGKGRPRKSDYIRADLLDPQDYDYYPPKKTDWLAVCSIVIITAIISMFVTHVVVLASV